MIVPFSTLSLDSSSPEGSSQFQAEDAVSSYLTQATIRFAIRPYRRPLF